MKRIRVPRYGLPAVCLAILIIGVVLLRLQHHAITVSEAQRQARVGCAAVESAFRRHTTATWLTLSAPVSRVLPDSYGRFEHQRFIALCPDGQTVLIVNDVSIGTHAPVRVGSHVAVRGEYIWGPQGGLVHFTHHGGPTGGGWILLRGRLYS